MDEKDVLEQEFDIDDIMKEFAELAEDLPEEPEKPETPEEEPQPAVTADTIRLDTIPQKQGTVRNAVPIGEEPESGEEPGQAEPFSDQWEPEYDQPISEYIPAAPIVFRPKSRLREIKRKLVAGPEKHYYALTEKGLGKLQAAIFFNVLVVLISAGATVMYALGVVPENRLKLMVFGQFLAMLLSALLGSFQLIEGGADLRRGRFSLNTMLLFTFLLCCVDGVLCLQQLRVPCCAAFSLQMTMSLWSSYQSRNTKLGQLDTMRKATRLDSISAVDDYCGQGKGLLRGLGQVEDFMDTYQDTPRRQKILSVYAIVALAVSIAAGILSGVLHGWATGIQVAAVTSLAATPASMFVIFSRPMAVLERRLHGVGTVLCGWQGAEALTGKTVFPIDHSDLYPANCVKMNGVKFFGSRQPDEIIAYAAAIIKAEEGTLAPLFAHLLDSRNGNHYDPENFRRYENGVGGEVNSEAVLAGSVHFLKKMGVEVPEGIRISQAVCVAIDGELSGLFAVTYEKDRFSAAGISTLCGYRKLRPVLLTGDFMLTPEFIRSSFGINAKKILFPDDEERRQMQQICPEEDARALALITGEGLAAFAYAVTGARSLKSAITLGITIHMIGGILGMLMMLILAILGETGLLTPSNMFLYELIWMIPGLLITEWTRSI